MQGRKAVKISVRAHFGFWGLLLGVAALICSVVFGNGILKEDGVKIES